MPRGDPVVSLFDRLSDLAGRVLVAMDFDGTLAEIVAQPDQVTAVPGALEALTHLVRRHDTDVAVVSGRSMADLLRMVPTPGVTLIGEHGAAWQGQEPPTPEGFAEIRALLEEAASVRPGARVEVKQASLVVHTRGMDHQHESEVMEAVFAALESAGHANFHTGKSIVDVGFVEISKGLVIDRLRDSLRCGHVVFAGDDTTDESVFERLRPADVGVKVGPGPTAAGYRVDRPADVVEILEHLARRAIGPGPGTASPG
jgi:trehalose 6-phosphate phosphatase